jgi:hypothetical protein
MSSFMIKVLRVGEPQRAGGRGNRRRCLPKQRAFDETKQMKHSEPSNVVRANFRFTANGVPIDDLMKRRCARLTSWPPRKDCRAMNLSVSLYRKFSPSLRSPDIFYQNKKLRWKIGKDGSAKSRRITERYSPYTPGRDESRPNQARRADVLDLGIACVALCAGRGKLPGNGCARHFAMCELQKNSASRFRLGFFSPQSRYLVSPALRIPLITPYTALFVRHLILSFENLISRPDKAELFAAIIDRTDHRFTYLP